MDLKRKLERLGTAGPGSACSAGPDASPPADGRDAERRRRVERLRALMSGVIGRADTASRERVRAAHARREPVEPSPLPGELRQTAHGPVHVLERLLEPEHCHGRVSVAAAREVDPLIVARLALDPGFEAVDPRGMLLLDTETTGLSGGTGTLAFLVGVAHFEDRSLRIEQMVLRRPGEEEPMLRLLAERLEAASCIVTYNGKSFDWPLIRTRYRINRIPVPVPPPHLDLLHCARRVFSRRLERTRLAHMEAELLGFVREQDVDGAEIPALYFDYLHGAQGSKLAGAMEHNAHDLVALAAILAELVARFESVRPGDDPRDHYGYARVAERARDGARAEAFAAAAAAGGGDAALTADALLMSARLARRGGDADAEERALLAALASADELEEAAAARVHLALAKLYEHRRRDPARALGHARRCSAAEAPQAHGRRLGRLTRRLVRAPV